MNIPNCSIRLFSARLDSAFSAESCVAFFLFFFFFFAFTSFKLETKFTVHETYVTVHALFRYCLYTVHETHSHFIQKKILKIGPTVLFTYLKIILLQCFQFSVPATISSIQMDP